MIFVAVDLWFSFLPCTRWFFLIHIFYNRLPMTPGDGASIQCWGTAVLLELRHSCSCLFQHAYSENKVDSPFYQKKSVFQKPWKDVAKSNGVMSGTIFNCTPLPNTGYMEAELLWWRGWALVKVKVHSPSWSAISACVLAQSFFIWSAHTQS